MKISRVRRSKREAKQAYDQLSHSYDFLAGGSEAPLMQIGLEMLAVNSGEKVLEIGAGTGRGLVELCSQVGRTGLVHAVDISRGMLNTAHSRLVKTGNTGHLCLVEGDGEFLPYLSEYFSAIFMSFTLELFDTPEIPAVLEECWRVLQMGGRLGVVSMLSEDPPGIPARLYEWVHSHFPGYADCRPINAGGLLHEAGFSLVRNQVRSMWGLPVEILLARK